LLISRTADPAYISALENQLAEKESEHKSIIDNLKACEAELLVRVDELSQQVAESNRELDKQKALQQDYRKLLNDILVEKKRHSHMSQSSIDSYPASTTNTITGMSRTELTSDYGDHDTLDKELAQADSQDEDEPDHTLLIAELKTRMKEDARISLENVTDHARVVKDLKEELGEVRSAYEEETSELQKTLDEVKIQFLLLSRKRSASESSVSSAKSESEQPALEKIKNLQRQITQHKEEHSEVVQLLGSAQKLADTREQSVIDLTASLDKLKVEHEHQLAKVASLTTEIEEVKSQNETMAADLEAAQENIKEAEDKATELKQLIDKLGTERDSCLNEIGALKDKLQSTVNQHEKMVKEMESAHVETVTNLKKDNSEYLTIIQHLKDQVSESEAAISTHLLQITSFQQKFEASTKDSEKAKRAKTAMERDLKDLRNEVGEVTRQRQETKEKLREVTQILEQLQKDYDALKARKASLSPESEAVIKEQSELIQVLEGRLAEYEARPGSAGLTKHARTGSVSGRWSNTPTPPPQMPLPPLPSPLPQPPLSPRLSQQRTLGRTNSQDQIQRAGSREQLRSPEPQFGYNDAAFLKQLEDKDQKIANLEKQFQSERQLVQTLEEALSDTEKSMKQLKKQTNSLAAEKEMLHTKMLEVSHQLEIAKKEAQKSRDSIQQLDEARAQRAKVR
jgi:chromosome segregation ATPase